MGEVYCVVYIIYIIGPRHWWSGLLGNVSPERYLVGMMDGKPGRPSRPVEERFWAKVRKEPGDGCWLWTGSVTKKHGQFWHEGAPKHAPRVAWELAYGEVPAGLVCHRCDRPLCVRIDHLFLGTAADNTADMVAKGRASCGSRNGQARLTELEVVEIRDLYAAGHIQAEISRLYALSRQTIWDVVHRKSWRHVPESCPTGASK